MTNALAMISDGKVRLIRPRKSKGAPTEVFANFIVPDGADDDTIARLTFQMMDLLNPAPPAEPAASTPTKKTADKPAKAHRNTGRTDRPAVVAALRAANAVDHATGLSPEALCRALGGPPRERLRKAISRLVAEGWVVAEGRTQSRRIWIAAEQTPRVEPDPHEGLPIAHMPPPVIAPGNPMVGTAQGIPEWAG